MSSSRLDDHVVNVFMKIAYGLERQMSENGLSEQIGRGELCVSHSLKKLIVREGKKMYWFDALNFCKLFDDGQHLQACELVKELFELQNVSFLGALSDDNDENTELTLSHALEKVGVLLWVEVGDLNFVESITRKNTGATE